MLHYRIIVKDNLVSLDGEQYFENLEKFVEVSEECRVIIKTFSNSIL